jgi:hypothetical protein
VVHILLAGATLEPEGRVALGSRETAMTKPVNSIRSRWCLARSTFGPLWMISGFLVIASHAGDAEGQSRPRRLAAARAIVVPGESLLSPNCADFWFTIGSLRAAKHRRCQGAGREGCLSPGKNRGPRYTASPSQHIAPTQSDLAFKHRAGLEILMIAASEAVDILRKRCRICGYAGQSI